MPSDLAPEAAGLDASARCSAVVVSKASAVRAAAGGRGAVVAGDGVAVSPSFCCNRGRTFVAGLVTQTHTIRYAGTSGQTHDSDT